MKDKDVSPFDDALYPISHPQADYHNQLWDCLFGISGRQGRKGRGRGRLAGKTRVIFPLGYLRIYILTSPFKSGLLARMEWYRVILDESQFIRTRCVAEVRQNPVSSDFVHRATRASLSVAKLRSRYRWMLSGTPVTNSL